MFKLVESHKSKVISRKLLKIVFFIFYFFYSLSSQAQCAMCRASLESEGNLEKAEAVNDGIVYLMAIPYIIVAVIAIVVYRMYKNKKHV